MTKKQKIDYINQINDRFINARNHGSNGSNWWYPKENRIAYNVKLWNAGGIDMKELRAKLTPRQNDYYSDDQLYEIIQEKQTDDANLYAEDIKNNFKGVKETGFAGRSAGWLEVDFINDINFYNDPPELSEINDNYKIATELDKNEAEVAKFIKESHATYCKYLGSKENINDIIESLQSDEDIADHYKGRIKTLTDKLK